MLGAIAEHGTRSRQPPARRMTPAIQNGPDERCVMQSRGLTEPSEGHRRTIQEGSIPATGRVLTRLMAGVGPLVDADQAGNRRSVCVGWSGRVLDSEVLGNHCRGFTAPINSPGDRLTLETAVAGAAAGPAFAVERQDPAGESVVDGVQSTHRVDPTSYRRRSIVDRVDDIHVKPLAGFLVVLVTRHEETLRRMEAAVRLHHTVPVFSVPPQRSGP